MMTGCTMSSATLCSLQSITPAWKHGMFEAWEAVSCHLDIKKAWPMQLVTHVGRKCKENNTSRQVCVQVDCLHASIVLAESRDRTKSWSATGHVRREIYTFQLHQEATEPLFGCRNENPKELAPSVFDWGPGTETNVARLKIIQHKSC